MHHVGSHWTGVQWRNWNVISSGATIAPRLVACRPAIPLVPNDVTKRFIRARKAVGLDTVRLHDLRRFTATRLLAEGVLVRSVSGRLVHSNAATTLDYYAHFVAESDRDAATMIGSVLQRQPAQSDRHGRAKWSLTQSEEMGPT